MVPSESAVRDVLKPYHAIFADASRAAMKQWLEIPPAQRAALDHPRAFANVVWSLFRNEATVRFSGLSGLTLTHKYNTLGIIVKNKLMLRFKRVNRQGRSRNFPTQASLRFYAQFELPGIPASCPRAEIGWREDDVRLGLTELSIVMRNGKHLAWRYSILEEGGTSVATVASKSQTTTPRRSRVRGKGTAADRKREEA